VLQLFLIENLMIYICGLVFAIFIIVFSYYLGSTGFDSEWNWTVSTSSAGTQLVNIMFQTYKRRK